ncbi:MAG: family 20 glycosylhydrolase, partial [Candidatus Hodarchaeota archaeon]
KPESYKLVIDDSGIIILGADEAGIFYAVETLLQFIELNQQESTNSHLVLPHLTINDWPDFPHRGVMIDISRDKVPTMETLFVLIELLSSWKINQVQLYMEHTFAYQGHEKVWKKASPFTGEEILELDAYCRERYIELVPNQNSFGHLHRWLIHDPYRELAECPEGSENPFNFEIEPFSLCPIDPRSIEFLRDLYDQLLPYFSSQHFNVGLDETHDLGDGRSMEICAKKGKDNVYLEFLQRIHSLVVERGRIMQFWADIILQYPETISELPKEIIPLIWGYEAEFPFDKQAKFLNDLGLAFYVCPGTSSWNSFAGRTENAIANLKNAAIHGKRNNALGYLITDWGDHGHLQPLPISYLGILIGAGLSWNVNVAAKLEELFEIPTLLNVHAFRDRAEVMGKIAYDLGNVYRKIEFIIPNMSGLFACLHYRKRNDSEENLADIALDSLSIESLEKTHQHINDIVKSLSKAKMNRKDADLVIAELQWVADILKFACDMGIARLKVGSTKPLNDIPKDTRALLVDKLQDLITQRRHLWLKRNRPGGLDDSLDRLSRIISFLEK